MNDQQFERLLFEEEGTTLDFKIEQYRFAKATDDEKSELLKDILGFANAWRRAESFILIGVRDVRGGRADVIGIDASAHLDDHSVQQFVNNLTNRPVRFRYEAFGYEGKQVGIICIEEQQRPLFLKRDYGKLGKNEVYVRRGSSTDPSQPAGPDEIAQMGNTSLPSNAEIKVEFGELDKDRSIGTAMNWEAELCTFEAKPKSVIRPVGSLGSLSLHALEALEGTSLKRPNERYFEQLRNYEYMHRISQPARLRITNAGLVAAKNVRVELTVPKGIGVLVHPESEMPDRPKKASYAWEEGLRNKFDLAVRKAPGEVFVEENQERFLVNVDCGDLQPGRPISSSWFRFAKRETGESRFAGLVFAENLPRPSAFELAISVQVTQRKMSFDELRRLPDADETD